MEKKLSMVQKWEGGEGGSVNELELRCVDETGDEESMLALSATISLPRANS